MLFVKRSISLALITLSLVCLFLPATSVLAKDYRPPVWGNRFYPGNPQALHAQLTQLCQQTLGEFDTLTDHGQLRALILPHAGYIYSGLTASHAARVLKKNQFKKVILIGPDHNVGFAGGAISAVSAYRTPLGDIPLHEDAEKLLKQKDLFHSSTASDRVEHSLEVILPFLQHLLGDFSLVPIVLGHGNTRRIGEAIKPLIDAQTLLVISSDLSHYLSYNEAVIKDQRTIQAIINLDAAALNKKNSACGQYGLQLLISMAEKLRWKPNLLHYSNSGDTAGKKDRVVGYSSIAFFKKQSFKPPPQETTLTAPQGRTLLKLARQTIAGSLGQRHNKDPEQNLQKELQEDIFSQKRGTFITLTRQGQLRGCIGSITPVNPLAEDVRKNAISAAHNDPRFLPLTIKEFDNIDIEVSILTTPESLVYKDGTDLIEKIRPSIDGVILRHGRHRSTYLPQVWDQLPDPEDFLSRLCLKAGLSPDAWKNRKLEVQTYQVQHFNE